MVVGVKQKLVIKDDTTLQCVCIGSYTIVTKWRNTKEVEV